MNSITLGILWGESYNSIRALADLFVTLKYPTSFLAPLPGNGCCSNFEPSWSSYLYLSKKILSFAFPYLYLDPCYPLRLRTFLLFLSLPLPPLPLYGYPRTHLPNLLGWVFRAILSGPSSSSSYEIHPWNVPTSRQSPRCFHRGICHDIDHRVVSP